MSCFDDLRGSRRLGCPVCGRTLRCPASTIVQARDAWVAIAPVNEGCTIVGAGDRSLQPHALSNTVYSLWRSISHSVLSRISLGPFFLTPRYPRDHVVQRVLRSISPLLHSVGKPSASPSGRGTLLCYLSIERFDPAEETSGVGQGTEDVERSQHKQRGGRSRETRRRDRVAYVSDRSVAGPRVGIVCTSFAARDIVESTLRYFDGTRYELGEFYVAPNHVHVIVRPAGNCDLSDIISSWKRFSTRMLWAVPEVRTATERSGGQLWQYESFDHLIRNDQHYDQFISYIRNHAVG